MPAYGQVVIGSRANTRIYFIYDDVQAQDLEKAKFE